MHTCPCMIMKLDPSPIIISMRTFYRPCQLIGRKFIHFPIILARLTSEYGTTMCIRTQDCRKYLRFIIVKIISRIVAINMFCQIGTSTHSKKTRCHNQHFIYIFHRFFYLKINIQTNTYASRHRSSSTRFHARSHSRIIHFWIQTFITGNCEQISSRYIYPK